MKIDVSSALAGLAAGAALMLTVSAPAQIATAPAALLVGVFGPRVEVPIQVSAMPEVAPQPTAARAAVAAPRGSRSSVDRDRENAITAELNRQAAFPGLQGRLLAVPTMVDSRAGVMLAVPVSTASSVSTISSIPISTMPPVSHAYAAADGGIAKIPTLAYPSTLHAAGGGSFGIGPMAVPVAGLMSSTGQGQTIPQVAPQAPAPSAPAIVARPVSARPAASSTVIMPVSTSMGITYRDASSGTGPVVVNGAYAATVTTPEGSSTVPVAGFGEMRLPAGEFAVSGGPIAVAPMLANPGLAVQVSDSSTRSAPR